MIPPGWPAGALLLQTEEPSCWPWALPSPVKPILQVRFCSLQSTKDHLAIVQVLSWNWIDCSSSRDYIERGLRKIEEEGCAVPISSIGGIGGEWNINEAILFLVFCVQFVLFYLWHRKPQLWTFFLPGMSGIPPPRTSVLSDNTAVGGSQGSQPQVTFRSKTHSEVLVI